MKKIGVFLLLSIMTLPLFAASSANAGTFTFTATFWALVPPLVAIVLALITKEVFFSLFTGIVLGGLFAGQFSLLKSMDVIIKNGLIEAVKGTAGVFIFLVVLSDF